MSCGDIDNLDLNYLFTPSGARIENNSAELRPPDLTEAIPAVPVTSTPQGAPKKKREVTCKECGVKGHMQKTCPTLTCRKLKFAYFVSWVKFGDHTACTSKRNL